MTHPLRSDGHPFIWPTAQILIGSDLYAWFHGQANHSPQKSEAYEALTFLTMRYACGECVFLASAIAKNAGETSRLIRIERTTGDPDKSLLHAVLCFDKRPLDEAIGVDILGRIRVRTLADSLAPMGPLECYDTGAKEWAGDDDFEPGQKEECLQIAGCLPWLARYVPAQYRIPEACALACLIDVYRDNEKRKIRSQDLESQAKNPKN